MSLRIRLVEPRPPGRHVYDAVLLPRLGLPLIATMLGEAGHEARVSCEVLAPIDLAACLEADLVGVSATTSTAPAAYRLADLLEQAGVPVVLGGPHVTFCPDEALGHARYVVRGEGEQTMLELVAALERGGPVAEVAGLSWRDAEGRAVHNPPRPACTQQGFEALPAPDLSLIEGHQRMTVKPVMTQWGCPYDCEFCSVTAMFSRRVRYRRADQVMTELAGLGADRVFFHDDNFVVSKARTAGLLRAMLAAGLTPEWFAQVRADTVYRTRAGRETDHEFLALMRRSGCRTVMIGIESVSDEALAGLGKKESIADSERAIAAFHEHGIAVHGMFVLGLDPDTRSSARDTAAFARRVGLDTIQIMMETPLPGTRLWDRLQAEGRLIDADWSLFDGHHAVMRPARMSPLDLQLSVIAAMKQFYSWRAIVSSGAAAAARHLPGLIRLAARPALVARLPAIGRLALRERWQELGQLLRGHLGPQEAARLSDALQRPALRFYGRRQIAAWQRQEQSQAHLARLALLAGAAGP